MSDDDLKVRIAGDLTDINKSLADLRRQTRSAGDDAKRAGNDFAGWGRQLDGLKRQIGGVVAAYASFRGIASLFRNVVRATIEQEKALAQVEARIKSTGGAAGLTADELVKMATNLQAATTFGDEEILTAQSQLLTFTRITRENFEAATEAALNLSTAMEQDLRTSIVQIGKALNDPIAGLTSLTRSGIQFTAQQRELIRSLVETGQTSEAQRVILAELETQFGGAARAARDTLGGAFAALKNAAGDLLEADDGLPGVTDSINELTATLQDPNTRAALQVLANGILGLAGLTADATAEFARLQRQFDLNSRSVLGTVTEVERLEQGLLDVERALDGKLMTTPLRFLFTSREELEQLQKDLTFFLETARNGGSGIIQRPDVAPEASPAPTADARIDLRTLQADLNAAGVILQDELKRLREGLDRELEAGLKTYSEYFQQRASLETQQIDQTLAQRRNALALLNEEIRLLEERGESTEQQEGRRKQLTAEILVLERQRGDIAGRAARDQADAERALALQLDAVATRLKAAQGDAIGARADELEREFRDLLQRLEAEGDAAGAALVRKLINVELAKAELGQLETEYQRVMTELGRAEQSLQAQVATGAISEFEARRRILDLYRATGTQIRALIPQMQALAEATGDPAMIERVRELEAALTDLDRRAADTANAMKAGFRDALEDFTARSLRNVKDIKGAFRSLVDDILNQFARIAARGVINQIFGAFAGAGSAHTGGLAGHSASIRKVSPLVFAGAPRMHMGGIAGLGPGEIPTILKRGEEVLTEDDPRHRFNGGGTIEVKQYIDARGAADPAGIVAAGEALKQQSKAEMFYEMRRGIKVR